MPRVSLDIELVIFHSREVLEASVSSGILN